MCRVLLGVIALSCTVFLAPFSAAAQNTSESVCAPVSDTESESQISAMDGPLDYNVRIDLLENGINPGFTDVPEIDKAQLSESLVQFQTANDLPVTGRLDPQTLAKLSIRDLKSDSASSVIERAKPSK